MTQSLSLPQLIPGGPPPAWADIDGPVHYLDFGGPDDAPVLLCVHGLGGSHLNWLSVAPALTAGCRVFALDLPAHGLTPVAGRSTSVHAVQGLLHRFIAEVTGAPVILVGNSMGGMITVLQAKADPASVAGAVLVDPALPHGVRARPDPLVAAAFLGYALPGIGERFLRERRGRFTAEQLVQQTVRLCLADPHRMDPANIEASVRLAHYRMQHPELDAGFLGAARSLLRVLWQRRDYEAAMASIEEPVLLIQGDRDRLVPVQAARALSRRRRSWRYEEIAGVGHVPQLEVPDVVVALVEDWLANEGHDAAERTRAAGGRLG